MVKTFTLQGDYLSKFGSYGSGDGQFNYPQGLTFNSKGQLYVVDYGNHRVQVFDGNRKKFYLNLALKGLIEDSSNAHVILPWTVDTKCT